MSGEGENTAGASSGYISDRWLNVIAVVLAIGATMAGGYFLFAKEWADGIKTDIAELKTQRSDDLRSLGDEDDSLREALKTQNQELRDDMKDMNSELVDAINSLGAKIDNAGRATREEIASLASTTRLELSQTRTEITNLARAVGRLEGAMVERLNGIDDGIKKMSYVAGWQPIEPGTYTVDDSFVIRYESGAPFGTLPLNLTPAE